MTQTLASAALRKAAALFPLIRWNRDSVDLVCSIAAGDESPKWVGALNDLTSMCLAPLVNEEDEEKAGSWVIRLKVMVVVGCWFKVVVGSW